MLDIEQRFRPHGNAGAGPELLIPGGIGAQIHEGILDAIEPLFAGQTATELNRQDRPVVVQQPGSKTGTGEPARIQPGGAVTIPAPDPEPEQFTDDVLPVLELRPIALARGPGFAIDPNPTTHVRERVLAGRCAEQVDLERELGVGEVVGETVSERQRRGCRVARGIDVTELGLVAPVLVRLRPSVLLLSPCGLSRRQERAHHRQHDRRTAPSDPSNLHRCPPLSEATGTVPQRPADAFISLADPNAMIRLR